MLWTLCAGLAAGVVIGLALSRALEAHARRDQPDGRALLSLEYELFTLARAEGPDALQRHAAAWRRSPVFARYPMVAKDEVVRDFLVASLLLLTDEARADDLDHLLTAQLKLHRRRPAPAGRAAARRRARTLESIRRSVLSMRRGAAPMTAVRAGRDVLRDSSSTQDITHALFDLPPGGGADAPS